MIGSDRGAVVVAPICPECGETLALDRVGDAVLDYVPAPPPGMRRLLDVAGPKALVWHCMACVLGNHWQPA